MATLIVAFSARDTANLRKKTVSESRFRFIKDAALLTVFPAFNQIIDNRWVSKG